MAAETASLLCSSEARSRVTAAPVGGSRTSRAVTMRWSATKGCCSHSTYFSAEFAPTYYPSTLEALYDGRAVWRLFVSLESLATNAALKATSVVLKSAIPLATELIRRNLRYPRAYVL